MSKNSNRDEPGFQAAASSNRLDRIIVEKGKQSITGGNEQDTRQQQGNVPDDTSRGDEPEPPEPIHNAKWPKLRSLSLFFSEDLEQAVKDQNEKIAKLLAQERQQSDNTGS